MSQLNISDLSCTYLPHHELEGINYYYCCYYYSNNHHYCYYQCYYYYILITTDASDSLVSCLQDAERNWQFNMFKFAEETNGNQLPVLTFHYIKTSGLCSRFALNEAKLSRFLCRIERGYLNNPYHSR